MGSPPALLQDQLILVVMECLVQDVVDVLISLLEIDRYHFAIHIGQVGRLGM